MAGNRTTERSADMSPRLTMEKAVFRASLMINESWILKKNLQYDALSSTLMASCSGKILWTQLSSSQSYSIADSVLGLLTGCKVHTLHGQSSLGSDVLALPGRMFQVASGTRHAGCRLQVVRQRGISAS